VARVRVNFEPDKKLGWLLPRRASHNLEWREYGNITPTVGRLPTRLSYESNSEYTKATYTPIDVGRGLFGR